MENKTKTSWEVKDRTYILKGKDTPIVSKIPSRHTQRKPLMWLDPEKGYQRELRYATNQQSSLVDEQQGVATLGHIVFRNGALFVKKELQSLQKMLSLYHPFKDVLYTEKDNVVEAENDLEWMELEVEALNIAVQLDIDMAESILRVDQGSKVSKMTSKEIKRDVLLFAKREPLYFLELCNDDSIELRNFGVKAVEAGILQLSADQRVFTAGKEKRKLFTVPFDEHPYSALAAWFKTDEGMEVYKSMTKKVKTIKK
jgi:hypothetical protein